MRPSGLSVLLVTAVALGPVAPAPAAAPAPPAPVVSPAADARLVTLKNGLQLLLAPDPTAVAVDVAVWYPAGSAHERPGLSGISRLFERLLSAGSAHYPPRDHERLVRAEGGTMGAFTGPDHACFHQTVPPGALELVLKLEADRMGTLALTADAVEAAKRAALEEKRRRDQASLIGGAFESLGRLAWPAHPYGRPVSGLDEDLARITLADCQDYYQGHYAPNGALVTIVGAFEPDPALKLAKRWLEPVKRRRLAAAAARPEPPQTAERRGWARMAVPFGTVLAGWRTPGLGDPDGPALAVLSRILTGGPDARLQRALGADPLRSLLVEGLLDSRRDGGLLCAVVIARPGADSVRVERTLVDAAERLAREPVGEEELARARRQEEMATLLAWQTVRGRADALGSAQRLRGDWRAAGLRLEQVRRLAPADIQRAAARVLVPAGRNLLWVAPTGATVPPAEGGR